MKTSTWMTLAFALVGSAPAPAADPLEGQLANHVQFLAAEARQGRAVGHEGLEAAARYVEQQLREAGVKPLPGHELRHRFDDDGVSLANVVGWIEGARPGDEVGYVVVGAHYDGQGVDAEGRVHPSADDNASGVAVLIELARLVTGELGPLERPVVLAAFTGEETGLRGSRWFVAHPPVPLERVVAMVNLDTVGRLQNGQLTVFGSTSAGEFEKILDGVNQASGFALQRVAQSSTVSDDAPFGEKGIPALHLFSGAHADYHRPSDTAEKLAYGELARVTWFTADLVEYLSRADTQLTYVPPGAAALEATPRTEGRRKVSFGSIPDFQRPSGGVLLTGVLPGSAAEQAGLAQGDIIVGFGGVAVDTLLDYSEAMKQFAPGDVVVVRFLREGVEREVEVTLTERK